MLKVYGVYAGGTAERFAGGTNVPQSDLLVGWTKTLWDVYANIRDRCQFGQCM